MCTNNTQNCGGCNQDPCGCKTSTDEVVYRGPALTCLGIQNCNNTTEILQALDGLICSQELVQIIVNNIVNNFEIYQQFVTLVNTSVDCETVLNCVPTTTSTTTVLGDLIIYNQTINSTIETVSVESGVFTYTNVFSVQPNNVSTGTHGITTAAIIVELSVIGNKVLELWINGVLIETLLNVVTGPNQFTAQVIYPTDEVLIKLV